MQRRFWDVNSSSVHQDVTIYFMEPQKVIYMYEIARHRSTAWTR